MKQIVLLILVWSQICKGQNTDSIQKLDYYKSIVTYLASDSLQGRGVGTIYESLSADFIFQQLVNAQLRPKRQYFHFQVSDSTKKIKSQNIYAFLDNKKDSTILIGAHYDHIGLGSKLSLHANLKGIHNGADDNASGVALLLGLCRDAEVKLNKNFNYLFVFYSAHEVGLFGSAYFLKQYQKKHKPLALVINFDMVGRMENEYKILKLFYSDEFKGKLEYSAEQFKYFQYRWEGAEKLETLDTKQYYKSKIKCLSVTTGLHNDYHKTTDDTEYINYSGMFAIEKYVLQLLLSFKTGVTY
jgi:hypothetical protein